MRSSDAILALAATENLLVSSAALEHGLNFCVDNKLGDKKMTAAMNAGCVSNSIGFQ